MQIRSIFSNNVVVVLRIGQLGVLIHVCTADVTVSYSIYRYTVVFSTE